jgi:hypothetical protein
MLTAWDHMHILMSEIIFVELRDHTVQKLEKIPEFLSSLIDRYLSSSNGMNLNLLNKRVYNYFE